MKDKLRDLFNKLEMTNKNDGHYEYFCLGMINRDLTFTRSLTSNEWKANVAGKWRVIKEESEIWALYNIFMRDIWDE